MKVLILGGAGYIGSVLTPYLQEKGDEVNVLDKFLYGSTKNKSNSVNMKYGDVCNTTDLKSAIDKTDVIVNLAAISNDPASDLNPELTWDINYKANEFIAKLALEANKRVIFASSCSVYGFSENGTFKENSQLSPVTLYAVTKMLSEKLYLQKGQDAIILRFATVYGHSPKPRLDLVVNTMIGNSYVQSQILVNGGSQWRPIIHVKDVAHAIYLAIHVENPKHRVYNVGANEQNYQIAQLADLIAGYLPEVEVIHAKDTIDSRSYKVDFTRVKKDLNFETKYTVADAVKEIYQAFEKREITDLGDDEYYRVKYLRKQLKRNVIRRKLEERYLIYTFGKQL